MKLKTTKQETQTQLDLNADQLRDMLYKMHLVRAFEEAAFDQFAAGKVHGTMHLAVGQEATGVGTIAALRPDDQIASTHRGHAHAIAKGQDVRDMMAELLGKATGVCLGQGGSMHMADLNLGSLGANGIVAGGIPLAVGAGLSAHLQQNNKVVLSFFGDGASNNANFHESLNMAAIWKLPVVFICENNQYAMSMPAKKGVSATRISDRATGYNIPGATIDGMDVLAVYEATHHAVARARRGDGPTLLELVTYRYKGHSKSDKQLYRSKEEVKEWESRDAIPRFQNWLVARGFITEAEGLAMQARAEAEIEAAIDYADAQPDPSPADMHKTVYYVEPEAAANPTKVLPAWIKNSFGPNTPINPPPGAREITYAEALREAMDLALGHDDNAFLMGEDIGLYGGAFGVTNGLFEKYGAERVRDTPISENCIAGTAIGAGMTGMRAIAEMQFMDFVTLAMEQIVLQGAKIRFMFGGKAHVSMVLRLPAGSGTGAAAQHSQTLEAWFVNVPGLKVVMPSTPYDAKGMLLAAIADNNPIMFVENKLLYKRSGPVPEGPYLVPLGRADIKRPGKDLTIVATSIMVSRALEAAGQLAKEGIDVEIVDPRTLKPYDAATIVNSVKKTGRLLVAHEAPLLGGYGGEIAALVAQSEAFAYLEAPVVRLGGADVPVPYNRDLERAIVPQVENIVTAARDLVGYRI
ncbi:MAG: 1-deoxy-D-xylulose-5-phosphate synthase [Anaerolineae bacterium]|nr:1-deoxy-D-xylulose-5-phosphate synthase [Anaerolineae bacterium]